MKGVSRMKTSLRTKVCATAGVATLALTTLIAAAAAVPAGASNTGEGPSLASAGIHTASELARHLPGPGLCPAGSTNLLSNPVFDVDVEEFDPSHFQTYDDIRGNWYLGGDLVRSSTNPLVGTHSIEWLHDYGNFDFGWFTQAVTVTESGYHTLEFWTYIDQGSVNITPTVYSPHRGMNHYDELTFHADDGPGPWTRWQLQDIYLYTEEEIIVEINIYTHVNSPSTGRGFIDAVSLCSPADLVDPIDPDPDPDPDPIDPDPIDPGPGPGVGGPNPIDPDPDPKPDPDPIDPGDPDPDPIDPVDPGTGEPDPGPGLGGGQEVPGPGGTGPGGPGVGGGDPSAGGGQEVPGTGTPGATGPQGPQGPSGPQGGQGIPGTPGLDGDQGAPGAQGLPGQPGAHQPGGTAPTEPKQPTASQPGAGADQSATRANNAARLPLTGGSALWLAAAGLVLAGGIAMNSSRWRKQSTIR